MRPQYLCLACWFLAHSSWCPSKVVKWHGQRALLPLSSHQSVCTGRGNVARLVVTLPGAEAARRTCPPTGFAAGLPRSQEITGFCQERRESAEGRTVKDRAAVAAKALFNSFPTDLSQQPSTSPPSPGSFQGPVVLPINKRYAV